MYLELVKKCSESKAIPTEWIDDNDILSRAQTTAKELVEKEATVISNRKYLDELFTSGFYSTDAESKLNKIKKIKEIIESNLTIEKCDWNKYVIEVTEKSQSINSLYEAFDRILHEIGEFCDSIKVQHPHTICDLYGKYRIHRILDEKYLVDDKWFEDVFKGATCEIETFGFGEKADLRAINVKHISRPGYLGVQYHVTGLMDFDVEIDIPGEFSVYNSLTAIAVCRHFNVPVEKIKDALKVAKVKGRIEMVKVSDDFTLMIDYAHNAMALESLLHTLRDYNPGRIVTVFGCGGNRSKTRRYEMGEVSGKLSDFTIITSDNPRFEEPQAIIDDIIVGMKKTDGKYIDICDRKEAIRYAIEHGRPGDVIVLAGKGHETYQEIKGVKYDMDERVLIKEVLEELKGE